DQRTEDPFAAGASAALFIGDVALRDDLYRTKPTRLDLGSEWLALTGLPFAFALWQAASGGTQPLRDLHEKLLDSRAYGMSDRPRLATRYAGHFDMQAETLEQYWNDLRFDLDDEMVKGLQTFYQLAAEIGEIP